MVAIPGASIAVILVVLIGVIVVILIVNIIVVLIEVRGFWCGWMVEHCIGKISAKLLVSVYNEAKCATTNKQAVVVGAVVMVDVMNKLTVERR
jgi:hypothetical protein